MDCQFYSVSKAREALGVSRLTVYRKIAEKKILAIRMGRKILIPAAFIETLVTQAMSGAQHTPTPELQEA
ncbi:MAG: excisionase family DNA-binding protein [Treponema sp.]|nr:excisionase family DNA-binding protein [Treponema sp.]